MNDNDLDDYDRHALGELDTLRMLPVADNGHPKDEQLHAPFILQE